MLIVSKFRDYYDKATHVVDKTVVYNRQQREMEKIPASLKKVRQHLQQIAMKVPGRIITRYKRLNGYYTGAVGFCGKIYPYAKHMEIIQGGGYQEKVLFLYDEKELEAHIREYYPQEVDKMVGLKELFTSFEYDTPFLEFEVPVFSFDYGYPDKLTLNAELRKHGFQKVFDSQQTFQQIMMYLTGPLVKRDEVPVTPEDMNRFESKGFDKRWSFRHPVNTPKKKKKQA